MSEERFSIPDSNATDTRKGRTAKTIAVWIVVIAFVALLYLISRDDPVARWLFFWPYVAFIVILYAVNVFRFRREVPRFHRGVTEGLVALSRGDLERAHDIFRAWAERTRLPQASALARHNLAWTLMRQGRLREAIAVAADNDERNRGALTQIASFATSAVDLALHHALLGDTATAERWMTEAEQRSRAPSSPSLPAMKAFVRAVLDCRAGRPDDAARQLDDGWAQYEGALTGEVLRPLRIVRAFAIAASGPRNAGIADTMIALSRPAYPREYEFLGVAWPEMATFLASHGLSRSAITADHTAAS